MISSSGIRTSSVIAPSTNSTSIALVLVAAILDGDLCPSLFMLPVASHRVSHLYMLYWSLKVDHCKANAPSCTRATCRHNVSRRHVAVRATIYNIYAAGRCVTKRQNGKTGQVEFKHGRRHG